jgi:tetratricopeptide (TPR) repeat protein
VSVVHRSRRAAATEVAQGVLDGDLDLEQVEAWARAEEVEAPSLLLSDAAVDAFIADASADEVNAWLRRRDELDQALVMLRDASTSGQHDAEAMLRAHLARVRLSELHIKRANVGSARLSLALHLYDEGRLPEAGAQFGAAAAEFEALPGEGWRELFAHSMHLVVLRRTENVDSELTTSEHMLQRALHHSVTVAEAIALRHRGVARAELRRDGAVEDLMRAVSFRDMSTDMEAQDFLADSPESYRSDLARIARTFGRYELAQRTYVELRERARASGDLRQEALAESEIGYTAHMAGDDNLAARHLRAAADIAEQDGDHLEADRWRRQAEAMAHITPDAARLEAETEWIRSAVPPRSRQEAYHLASRVEWLLGARQGELVRKPAEWLRAWAHADQDVNLEMRAAHLLASALLLIGDTDGAIRSAQEAVGMADRRGDVAASVRFRQLLATAYFSGKRGSLAMETLFAARAFSANALADSRGSETRQQIAAGNLRTFEILASASTGSGDHESMIGYTESARTQNLEAWMTDSARVAQFPGRQQLVRELRTIDIELEVDQIAGNLIAETIRHSTNRRDEIIDQLRESGVLTAELASDALLLPDPGGRVEEVTAPGDALLFLFAIEEGICVALAFRDVRGVRFTGKFLEWRDTQRRLDLAAWHIPSAGDPQQEGPNAASIHAAVATLRARLFDPVLPLFAGEVPTRLVVFPHGDLAAVPYWELASSIGVSGGLTLAPSLDVYAAATVRERAVAGRTLIVEDATRSLWFSRAEVADLRSTVGRDATTVIEMAQILEEAPTAALLHVAAHAVFNPDNPYLGGVIVSDTEPAGTRFPQYVRHGRRFSPKPEAGTWPLLTVAECMTALSLDACRLAVLSACESGVPRIHRGGELTGLPNAMLLAGAKSVIASLWRVDDAATAVLMHHFYQAWEKESSEAATPAACLQVARDRLKATTRAEAERLIGSFDPGPATDVPFADAIYADAFHCFGAF